jgi:hypothetical protein
VKRNRSIYHRDPPLDLEAALIFDAEIADCTGFEFELAAWNVGVWDGMVMLMGSLGLYGYEKNEVY